MLKYQDQYRVLFEKDIYGKKCEFTYIPCSRFKGTQIYRYSKDVLAVQINSLQVARSILKEYSKLFKIELETSCEVVLLFDEVDLINVANILKARKKVKKILTESQKEILRERIQGWNNKKPYKNPI